MKRRAFLILTTREQGFHPMSVQELEVAISQLPPHELAELMAWLVEYQAKVWDHKIESDLEAGRLDAVLAEVDRECEAGLPNSGTSGSKAMPRVEAWRPGGDYPISA
jgi:hypothetical protein